MQIPVQEFINKLSDNQLRIGLEITVGLLVSLLGISATFAMKTAKKYVKQNNDRQERIEMKVDKMATNCLPTIQANTGRAAELLERLLEGQAEMNGYLKGKLE
jgi:hypothetical protein